MADMAHYTCPVEGCGVKVESDTVNDPLFGARVRAHQVTHDPEAAAALDNATIIAALTMLGLNSADPVYCIGALNRLGLDMAEAIIVEGREKQAAKRKELPGEVARILNTGRQNGDLISESMIAYALEKAGV